MSELKADKVLLEDRIDSDKIAVAMGYRGHGGTWCVVQPLLHPTIKSYPPTEVAEKVFAFNIDRPTAQAFLDALWAKGVRPSSGEQYHGEGERSAMKEHIADLRKMLARALPKPNPDTPNADPTW